MPPFSSHLIDRMFFRYAFYFALLLSSLAWSIASQAIPSFTEHCHSNTKLVNECTTYLFNRKEIEDDPDPDMPQNHRHQHRDGHSLLGRHVIKEKFGFELTQVWDNNLLRLFPSQGHGYMEEPAKYAFVDLVDKKSSKIPKKEGFVIGGRWESEDSWKNLRSLINDGFAEWERLVNGLERNINNVLIRSRVDFEETKNDDWDVAIIVDHFLKNDLGNTYPPEEGMPSDGNFDALLTFPSKPLGADWYLHKNDKVPDNHFPSSAPRGTGGERRSFLDSSETATAPPRVTSISP
jgi:hypothetical protein